MTKNIKKPHHSEDQFLNLYNLQRNYPSLIEIQHILSNIYDRPNVILSDRETIGIIESNKPLRDKNASSDDTLDLLGLATYSNSESTVSSYATIFDTIWIRSDISLESQA